MTLAVTQVRQEAVVSDEMETGHVVWNLDDLYRGLTDPRLEEDLSRAESLYRSLYDDFRGQLSRRLADGLALYESIDALTGQIQIFLFLSQARDVTDEAARKVYHEGRNRLFTAYGRHGVFFELELARLTDQELRQGLGMDPAAHRLGPWMAQVRRRRAHLLSEDVEGALARRRLFGSEAWSDYYREVEGELRFDLDGRREGLTPMLHLLSADPDGDLRARVLQSLERGFSGGFARYAAQTLSVVVGAKRVEDQDRGYPHPMASRNLDNQVDDATVALLHQAVVDKAAPLGQRYYRLKARLMGRETLRWSDRNAPLPFHDDSRIPFSQALDTVLTAYAAFSPELARIARELAGSGRIDAPLRPGKQSGAFNYSVVLPDQRALSYILLNYQGSGRDVMTLAHEMGHAVHGILAGRRQGPLLAQAPMAYAETASIFGEMTTFEHLRSEYRRSGNAQALRALLCGKIEDFLNTVVRQIGFSLFEQRLHAASGRLSPGDVTGHWRDTLRQLYGADDEVFSYAHTDLMWCYISHFHRPFYVYAYAFGELLTQGLFAVRQRVGTDFEARYLDMLSSGGARSVTELLEPFGLRAHDAEFWAQGIQGSLGVWMDELEAML
ncbi:MAG: M3 family oligoendopeptidase [Magnetococcus sp. WYHC-3]